MVVTVYTILIICWPLHRCARHCSHRKGPAWCIKHLHTEGGELPCWTCIFGGLKLVYGNHIEENKLDGKKVYSICGRHVKPWLMALLFMVIMFVCSCTFVAFWSEFLVAETFSCDSGLDCFPFNSTGDLIQERPIENCSNFELMDDVTIRCYSFVFDYASALGNAGGVLVLASVVMNIQAGLWIGASAQTNRCVFWAAVSLVTLSNIVAEILLIATPFVVNYVPLFSKSITNSNQNKVQFYTYWATFLCAFTFAGPIFIIFSRQLKNKMHLESHVQFGSVHEHSIAENQDSDFEEEWARFEDTKTSKAPLHSDVV